MPTPLHEFLRAQQQENNQWTFHIPVELHGAFGGAFGGVVAACTLVAARTAAPGRKPNAIDCRFMRGLSAGGAFTRASVLHSGRTLSTVAVDLFDDKEKLCTRSTVSLVDAAALHDFELDHAAPTGWIAHEDATAWPAVAPIVTALDSRIVGNDEGGIATALRIPWDVDADSSPEAACMAGDMSVGPPVGGAVPSGVRTPNPDLSLRFCGEVTSQIVIGACRLDRAHAGVAATSIEVYSDGALVANGVSSSLLLPS